MTATNLSIALLMCVNYLDSTSCDILIQHMYMLIKIITAYGHSMSNQPSVWHLCLIFFFAIFCSFVALIQIYKNTR